MYWRGGSKELTNQRGWSGGGGSRLFQFLNAIFFSVHKTQDDIDGKYVLIILFCRGLI